MNEHQGNLMPDLSGPPGPRPFDKKKDKTKMEDNKQQIDDIVSKTADVIGGGKRFGGWTDRTAKETNEDGFGSHIHRSTAEREKKKVEAATRRDAETASTSDLRAAAAKYDEKKGRGIKLIKPVDQKRLEVQRDSNESVDDQKRSERVASVRGAMKSLGRHHQARPKTVEKLKLRISQEEDKPASELTDKQAGDQEKAYKKGRELGWRRRDEFVELGEGPLNKPGRRVISRWDRTAGSLAARQSVIKHGAGKKGGTLKPSPEQLKRALIKAAKAKAQGKTPLVDLSGQGRKGPKYYASGTKIRKNP